MIYFTFFLLLVDILITEKKKTLDFFKICSKKLTFMPFDMISPQKMAKSSIFFNESVVTFLPLQISSWKFAPRGFLGCSFILWCLKWCFSNRFIYMPLLITKSQILYVDFSIDAIQEMWLYAVGSTCNLYI